MGISLLVAPLFWFSFFAGSHGVNTQTGRTDTLSPGCGLGDSDSNICSTMKHGKKDSSPSCGIMQDHEGKRLILRGFKLCYYFHEYKS